METCSPTTKLTTWFLPSPFFLSFPHAVEKMEIDPRSLENSDQVGPSQFRSYDCTFCKRGFSNAQALGGHMNIHRRDRAKLNEVSSNSSQPSLDITKKNPFQHQVISTNLNSLELESSEEKGCTLSWPGIYPRKDDGAVSREETYMGERRKLQLFDEMPSGNEYWRLGSCSGGREERKIQSIAGSAGVELDLELRLGPERQDTSIVGTG